MKRIVFLTLPLMMFAAAQSKPATKPSPSPAAKTAAPAPVTIPADATQLAPNVWRHTDKAGKTWIYRQTPFGLSKVEDNSSTIAATSAAAPANSVVDVKAIDLGETVRFEKPTPMGNRVWTRKKTELSSEEKDWLEKSKPASDPGKQSTK